MKISKIKLIAFCSTMLVSVDLLSVAGLRVTLLPLLLYGIYIIYKTQAIDKWFFYILFFAGACVPSLMFSSEFTKSAGYLLWIFFNYISLSIVYKYLITKSLDKTLSGVRDAYRLQILLGCALYFTGIQPRASVLYYEPSYFALSLTPYVVMIASSYIKSKGYIGEVIKRTSLIDVFLLMAAIYTTKSANLILVCGLSVMVIAFLGKGKIKKIFITAALGAIAIGGLYYYSLNSSDLIAVTIYKLFNSPDPIEALLDRTGNRWPRFNLAYDTAMTHLWGVGIGAFEQYTLTHTLLDYMGLPFYLSPIGYPPINIYLEIAATCGWPALAVWLVWHFKMIKQANYKTVGGPVIVCSLIVAMLALFIESSFMRPYYWMLIGMVMGQITLNKQAREE